MLKKELQCLNREEKNSACSMTIDQRIITTRFRNKLHRSAELMEYHDKLISRFHNAEGYMNPREIKKVNFAKQTNPQRSKDQKQNKEKIPGYDSQFAVRRFTGVVTSRGRPKTAVEIKSNLWSKRAEIAIDRVVRAKSAPPHSWSKCEDIMAKLNCGGGGFYATKNKKRPLSRAKFYEVFDSQGYNQFREVELAKQAHEVESFIRSVEVLKLAPWYPGPPRKKDNAELIADERTQRPRRSGFITRTDGFD